MSYDDWKLMSPFDLVDDDEADEDEDADPDFPRWRGGDRDRLEDD